MASVGREMAFRAKRNFLPPKRQLGNEFQNLLTRHFQEISAMDPKDPLTQFRMKQFEIFKCKAETTHTEMMKGNEYQKAATQILLELRRGYLDRIRDAHRLYQLRDQLTKDLETAKAATPPNQIFIFNLNYYLEYTLEAIHRLEQGKDYSIEANFVFFFTTAESVRQGAKQKVIKEQAEKVKKPTEALIQEVNQVLSLNPESDEFIVKGNKLISKLFELNKSLD